MKTNNKNNTVQNQYDSEWIQLIQQAKKMGLTKEEVRNFLSKRKALRR